MNNNAHFCNRCSAPVEFDGKKFRYVPQMAMEDHAMSGGSYKYGLECYICHGVNPHGRYLPHEGRMYFCGKHSNQEIINFQSMPEDTSRVKRRKIITNSICPPIPTREIEAINNLEEKLSEDLSDAELLEYAERHQNDHGNEGKVCRFFLAMSGHCKEREATAPKIANWNDCDHEWRDVDDISGRGVECVKCHCPGERGVENPKEIYWPAT